ncbi:hypothetical protein FGRMN_7121 [Fusarium graminum]|nr:hypothetical protein FGRMN_7121 [Fusarium graminum]
MQGTWKQAAKALKPAGTVALWTGRSIRVETLASHTALQVLDVTLETLELALGTGSPATRCKGNHFNAAETDDDVIHRLRWKIEKILAGVGVQKVEEVIKGNADGVL